MRLYLIGAGVIAGHHAAAALGLAGGDVEMAVADPNPTALANFVQRFPTARTFVNSAEMLAEGAQPNDIVVVATPPSTHYALALAALHSGRHVLCEKPLAMDVAQATEMVDLAKTLGLHIGCCSSRFLGLPTTATVKELIRSGVLGAPYHLTFIQRHQRSRSGIEYQPGSRWFLDPALSGGGVVMDWGPYDFAAINDLLDPVEIAVVGAWLANPVTAIDPPLTHAAVEQHAAAVLQCRLQNGAIVRVTYERAACTHGEARSTIELEGSHGAVTWDWLMLTGEGEVIHRYDHGGHVTGTVTGCDHREGVPFHHKPLTFFYHALTGERTPAILGEQALFNFACLRAVYDCARTGHPQVVQKWKAP